MIFYYNTENNKQIKNRVVKLLFNQQTLKQDFKTIKAYYKVSVLTT
ncbi:hypothetical protein QW060_10370 [Myroides ceti]|uniref:Uncharacterized protein n=1 Tax=Paenimyroides ceti TaxID=395087 RepID=A0ABT8CU71_9FLAO|nr:hypothetical protein [Paenimyroides ceti]MDN3707536.1 hypothetical protein [Paenimyroides ceti]